MHTIHLSPIKIRDKLLLVFEFNYKIMFYTYLTSIVQFFFFFRVQFVQLNCIILKEV